MQNSTMDKPHSPFFSVIIPTRNRPDMFAAALQSVMMQDFEEKEIIIVDDGSDDADLAQYDEIFAQYNVASANHAPITVSRLMRRAAGHGPSFVRNHGVSLAQGQYVCFLDDDDYWTDPTYLRQAHQSLATKQGVDLYYSNQAAYYQDGTRCEDTIWIEDLIEKRQYYPTEDRQVYETSAADLLQSGGFAHLNCSIFRRDFFISIGGMDEHIRYESDRDLYLRAIDQAQNILYDPHIYSWHNIPDHTQKNNTSTRVSILEKKVFQLRTYNKGILYGRHPEVIASCRHGKSIQLKVIAEELAQQGDYPKAFAYAWQALADGFNVKWLAYTVYLGIRKCVPTKKAIPIGEGGTAK